MTVKKSDINHICDLSKLRIDENEISTFTKQAAEDLTRILSSDKSTLLHCSSGNRVGALIALAAFWCEGLTAQESLDKGLQAGLTKLLPQIKQLLEL